jgi:hypothetical protein
LFARRETIKRSNNQGRHTAKRRSGHLSDDVLVWQGAKCSTDRGNHPTKENLYDASGPIAGVDSRTAMDGAEPKLKEENAKDVLNA